MTSYWKRGNAEQVVVLVVTLKSIVTVVFLFGRGALKYYRFVWFEGEEQQ